LPFLELAHVYFLDLISNIDEDAQIIISLNKKGEHNLAIRQPYIEGMLPLEYSVILKALK
jgi:hypothetical protein